VVCLLLFITLLVQQRVISVDFASGAEAGEVLDAGFELFDFVLELLRLWFVDSGELVFEALKPRFLAFFVDIGLADVLAFVDP